MTTTEYSATERSESMSEEVQGDLSHEPAETENPNKNDDDEELQSDQLQMCQIGYRSSGMDW